MLKRILAGLAFLTLAACTAPKAPSALHYLVPKAQKMAVTVQTDRGMGSGVWISPTHILTAKHVVKTWDGFQENVWLETPSGDILMADLVDYVAEGEGMINSDWVVLEVYDAEKLYPGYHAKVDCGPRLIGEQVFGIGNAHGYTGLLPFIGRVQWPEYSPSALIEGMEGYWSDAILTNMDGAPGVSGGPVFDMDGELIGLMVGAFQDPRGGSFLQVTYPARSIAAICP